MISYIKGEVVKNKIKSNLLSLLSFLNIYNSNFSIKVIISYLSRVERKLACIAEAMV